MSAIEYIERQQGDLLSDPAQFQQVKALIASYEKQYETVSNVFNEVHTLFQLLQILESHSFLRDSFVDMYKEMAGLYQENVRDYRKLHVEYTMEYGRLDKHFKKQTGLSLAFLLEEEEDEIPPPISEHIQNLNNIQVQCEQKLKVIKKYEQFVLEKLDAVQGHLNELAEKHLSSLNNQLKELESQRIHKWSCMTASVNKLEEFNCLAEAQHFLKAEIAPFLSERVLPIKEQENMHIQQTVDRIAAVDFTYEAPSVEELEEMLALLNFKKNYHLFELRLTEKDIVSDIPELPEKIEI